MHNLAHCCLQGVCCPPGSEEQKAGLAKALDRDILGTSAGNGRAVADWIDDNGMALVPKELAVAMNEIFAAALKLKLAHAKGDDRHDQI